MHKLILAGLLIGACGGDSGSGVDSSKQIKDLSASEQMSVCEAGVAAQGGAGKMTNCGNGVTVTVKSVADCVSQMGVYAMKGCTATVGQLEACNDAIGMDPCSLGGSACQPILACAQ
jgi:hypothetical protein